MALSYSLSSSPLTPTVVNGKIPVLITGATGNIGRYYAEHANENLALHMLVRKHDDRSKKLEKFGTVVLGDITDPDSLETACRGMDTIIHLAGEASPEGEWDDLLDLNIKGTYHLFSAAKKCGCRRIIYASSIHAISGYPADIQVKGQDPVNPGDLYGVTKCFSEALGRYMAEQSGISVLCLRIGAFQQEDFARSAESLAIVDAWVSPRDLTTMLDLSVQDSSLQFAIFNALSDNRFKRMDISDARELLGYCPQDDATRINPILKGLHLSQVVATHVGDDSP